MIRTGMTAFAAILLTVSAAAAPPRSTPRHAISSRTAGAEKPPVSAASKLACAASSRFVARCARPRKAPD